MQPTNHVTECLLLRKDNQKERTLLGNRSGAVDFAVEDGTTDAKGALHLLHWKNKKSSSVKRKKSKNKEDIIIQSNVLIEADWQKNRK